MKKLSLVFAFLMVATGMVCAQEEEERGLKLNEPFEPVVAVDYAPVQVVKVAGGESAAV